MLFWLSDMDLDKKEPVLTFIVRIREELARCENLLMGNFEVVHFHPVALQWCLLEWVPLSSDMKVSLS